MKIADLVVVAGPVPAIEWRAVIAYLAVVIALVKLVVERARAVVVVVEVVEAVGAADRPWSSR